MAVADVSQYLGHQTVLAGAVNSGKTTQTAAIVEQFLRAGYGANIALLDLAPNQVSGIGGKLCFDKIAQVVYLTDEILAPRLMGRDADHTLELATHNARTIEKLFAELESHGRDILFINDVTLYLQAGNINILLGFLENFSTKIINAYYGHSFDDSELSQRERQLTDFLMDKSDAVILL